MFIAAFNTHKTDDGNKEQRLEWNCIEQQNEFKVGKKMVEDKKRMINSQFFFSCLRMKVFYFYDDLIERF